MNIRKYIFVAVGAFLVIVALAIGVSARFSLSNITADPYTFIESFFNQWSPALAAASTIILVLTVLWTIHHSRRREERDKQQVIHALHDEIHSNLTDVTRLRFQISETFRKTEESNVVDTRDAPFQLIDAAVFDSMKNAGQLHQLENIRMHIIFCYKLIKLYNYDAGFRPYHLELLANIHEGLSKAIRDLEAKFKFLPRYIEDKEKSKQTEQLGDKAAEAKKGLLGRKPWVFLLPFATIVVITVGLLIAIAFIHPLDSEFTLSIRWSYVCYGLAGMLALLAALFSGQRRLVIGILILAIELYVGGMLFQLLGLIT